MIKAMDSMQVNKMTDDPRYHQLSYLLHQKTSVQVT